MANAGCINAYDCSGNLIRTLEQLQSSNIGVGVQYTAPNPLDDKKIDYIKYTDKCGNTCCLTGENEILIYATNGVIKNLTLTNDDVNEAVVVKWNDIFGSNRAKTVVRYKTGSAPISPTDGTLAVEETTKNQYSTNGFSVTGLSDSTTYYFSVFALDIDGTMIDVQSSSIQTDFSWKPGNDTVAYFPFDTNFNDSLGNYNLTTKAGSPSITTLNGLKCLYLNGSSSVGNNNLHSTLLGQNFTIQAFVRVSQTEVPFYTSVYRSGSSGYGFYISAYIGNSYGLQSQIWQGNSTNTIVQDTNPLTQSKRYLITLVFTNGTVKYYQNGSNTKTASAPMTSSANELMRVGSSNFNSGGGEQYFGNGYVSRLIAEKKAWSESDIVKYFNKLKSQYGY